MLSYPLPTLSGLQFNISGIIGPALGGLLGPLAGAHFGFALNAACFLLVVLAIRQWKQPSVVANLPSESFFESFGTVIRFSGKTFAEEVEPVEPTRPKPPGETN